jgi:Glycosyltransferase family 87
VTASRLVRGAAVAIVLVVIAWQIGNLGATLAREGHLADASSYHAAVQRWLSGSSPYSAEQLSGPHTMGSAVGGNGFVYPPLALPLFLPLAPGVEATLAWVLLTHAAFLVVVFAIARRELGDLPLAASLVVVALALALPGMNEIRLGNASALIATLIGLIWLLPRWGALFAVIAGSIKVFPLLAVPWSARWGASLVPAAVVGLVLVAISLLIGPQRWVEWVTAMTTAVPSCPTWALPSLPCVTGSSVPGVLLAAVLFIGAIAAPSRPIGFLLLSVAMIVPAPDLYQHYLLVPFVGALPAACAAVLAGREAWMQRRSEDRLRGVPAS